MLLSPRDLRTGFGRLSIIFPWLRKAFQNETLCQFYENRTFQTSKYADFDFFAPGSFHGFWSWKFIKITNWHNIVFTLWPDTYSLIAGIMAKFFEKRTFFTPLCEMLVFRKIWRALFSWNTRFEIRLLPYYRHNGFSMGSRCVRGHKGILLKNVLEMTKNPIFHNFKLFPVVFN